MTGALQTLADLKTILATDRRVWLAGGFIFACIFIFMVTGSWREPHVEEVPEEWKRVRIPVVGFNEKINALNASVEESRREREELRARLTRAANEIQAEQQQIDWQMDRLIDSLESMSSKVDGMVSRVGGQLIKEKELERLSSGNSKKKKQRY